MTRPLASWTRISGWSVGRALAAGELRAVCASPWCDRSAAMAAWSSDPEVPLWVLAMRMRCRRCGHRGAQFELWRRRGGLSGAPARAMEPP
jgi:hypothetical protein